MPCTAVNIYYVSLGGLEVDYICDVCMYKTFAAFTYVTLTKYVNKLDIITMRKLLLKACHITYTKSPLN